MPKDENKLDSNGVEEKAKSKAQQRLMGMAYAYKTGKLKLADIDDNIRDEILNLAKSMTKKQLRDFAKTKHDGLPQKVEEGVGNVLTFDQFKRMRN